LTAIKATLLVSSQKGEAISGGVTVEGQALRRYKPRKIQRDLRKALRSLEKEMMKEVKKQ